MSPTPEQRAACQAILDEHARTFSLASRFLAEEQAARAAVVYAWCRRADDAIDHAEPGTERAALQRLEAELDQVYGSGPLDDQILGAFRGVVQERSIPRLYPDELLRGMAMDVERVRYPDESVLRAYCYRVAGVVGLMMAHVLGVRDDEALPAALALGMAMQLTNIARDIAEDSERGRCYLPATLTGARAYETLVAGAWRDLAGDDLKHVGTARAALLAQADRWYTQADEGLPFLDGRSALGIRIARLGYASIGRAIERRGVTRLEGRAYVGKLGKAGVVARALGIALARAPGRLLRRGTTHVPRREVPLAHALEFQA